MLERVSLFHNLKVNEITQLEAIGQKRSLPKNSQVISEGDDTDSLHIVLRGKAHALRSDTAGRQFIVNRFGPYDYFGEMSLFDRHARCATVVTKEKCTMMLIRRNAFLAFAALNPEIYWNMIKDVLKKLRRATQQIEQLAFLDVYGRLSRFLIENQNGNNVIEEKLTQQELADLVGSSRETVCRIFSELVEGGYISKKNGHIKIERQLPYKF